MGSIRNYSDSPEPVRRLGRNSPPVTTPGDSLGRGRRRALPPPAAVAVNSAAPGVSVESEAAVARPYPNIHGGNGTISVRYFPFDQQPMPAHFVIYEIPPGASEGVHTHHLGDNVQGPFDEYYYIIEGEGEMPIDGRSCR